MTDEAPAASLPALGDPLEDGRTRCSWVKGTTRHYAFHDAEWAFVPDTEELAQEKLLLAAFMRGTTLVEVLDHRGQLYDRLHHWDLAKIGAMTDAELDDLAKAGGLFADRARLGFVRGVADAGAQTAAASKGIREYFLVVRFLDPEALIADMSARFPGFTRADAANLSEMIGAGAGTPHERDCWRA
jgi:3-methyladenine DNA glycosylase Tag